jgi:UPF0716 protein FxsA
MFLILFIVWVAAELFVIVEVAEAIGVLLTIVLLIAAWPLGIWAVRSEGRVVWRRLSAALAEGRPPGREVVDGALVVLGGGLLMVPGFISDFLGLLLLFPPSRVLARTGIVRNFEHRLVARAARFGGGRGAGFSSGGARGAGVRGGPRRGGAGRGGASAPGDVEGTATEVDPPSLQP